MSGDYPLGDKMSGLPFISPKKVKVYHTGKGRISVQQVIQHFILPSIPI
jgi:hypothetical protein